MKGRKFDKGKIRPSLIDPTFLKELAELLTVGAQKYDDDNWKIVENAEQRYRDALERHLIDWKEGTVKDDESFLLIKVACNAMFLRWFERRAEEKQRKGTERDGRLSSPVVIDDIMDDDSFITEEAFNRAIQRVRKEEK